jgi:outer membrane protein assembly factor BamD (BamD/ComL family)
MHLLHLGTRTIAAALSAALLASLGCAAMSDKSNAFPAQASRDEQKDWWKAHRKEAVFVPGQGYTVAGVPGYFDENGRPMQSGADLVNFEKTEATKALFPNLSAKNAYTSAITAVGLGPQRSSSAAQQKYAEAEALYREKKYSQARSKFSEAAELGAGTGVEDDAMFMVGECFFFDNAYDDANDAYAELIKEYPNSRHLDRMIARQFSIAHYWQQYDTKHPDWPLTPNFFDKKRTLFDTKGHALRVYEQIRLNDPTGPLADDALMATANAHFVGGRFEDADYHYSLLRSEYPDSEHLYQAMTLGLQAKVRMYQGADYDSKPLEEARKLADQLLTQFSDKLGDERERVQQTRQDITAKLAKRDWTLAKYYSGRKEYGAARYYYNHIAREYPTSNLAEEARTRMAEIQDEPNRPPQKLAWLVNLFPGEGDQPLIAEQPQDSTLR